MRRIAWETMAVAACLSRGAARKAVMDEMVRKYRRHHSLKASRSMAARAVRRAWTRGRRNAARAEQTAFEIASGVRAIKLPNPGIIVRKRVSSRGRVSYVARPLRTVLVDSARAIWARHRDNPLFKARWPQARESAFIRAYCAEMQRFGGYVASERAALVYADTVGAVRVPLKPSADCVRIYKPGDFLPETEKTAENGKSAVYNVTKTVSAADSPSARAERGHYTPPDRQEHLAPAIVQPVWRECRALADDAKHIRRAQHAYYRARKRGIIPAQWIVDALDRAEIDRTCGYKR